MRELPMSEGARAKVARLNGREPDEIQWLTVDELCAAIDVGPADAIRVIRAYGREGLPVEKIAPHLLARDVGVTPRTLLDWERKGLPATGFRNDKAYVAPVCYEWIEQFQKGAYSTGTSGFRRKHLTAIAVIERVLNLPLLANA